MEEFPYYGLSWFIYLIVAASFLLLVVWKTRNWSVWTRVPLITFIAAMAFTPGTTVSGEPWLSPAAIIMIFGMDQNGLSGIWAPLTSIIMVWLLLMLSTGLIRWKLMKYLPFLKKSAVVEDGAEDINSQPELKEPD